RQLSRRAFFWRAAVGGAMVRGGLAAGDREFLDAVAKTLIPAAALQQSGVDVVANIEHILARGSAEHRAKVFRLVAWARRVSFLYGGEQVALRARTSRFVLAQKMSRALSALCLVAFWGDERTLALIDASEATR
ncbi:MAG: hypothetical protein ACREEM_08555, partial [Blastocatellia bacterium]